MNFRVLAPTNRIGAAGFHGVDFSAVRERIRLGPYEILRTRGSRGLILDDPLSRLNRFTGVVFQP